MPFRASSLTRIALWAPMASAVRRPLTSLFGRHGDQRDLATPGLVDQLQGHLDAVGVRIVEDELAFPHERVAGRVELARAGRVRDLLDANGDVHAPIVLHRSSAPLGALGVRLVEPHRVGGTVAIVGRRRRAPPGTDGTGARGTCGRRNWHKPFGGGRESRRCDSQVAKQDEVRLAVPATAGVPPAGPGDRGRTGQPAGFHLRPGRGSAPGDRRAVLRPHGCQRAAPARSRCASS